MQPDVVVDRRNLARARRSSHSRGGRARSSTPTSSRSTRSTRCSSRTARRLRATVSVALVEVPNEPAGQNPTSGSLAGHRTARIVAGESLHSIAYREYGSADALARPRRRERDRRPAARRVRERASESRRASARPSCHDEEPPCSSMPSTWPTPTSQINGAALPVSVNNLLERVVVDDHLRLPAMFELTLRRPARLGACDERARRGGGQARRLRSPSRCGPGQWADAAHGGRGDLARGEHRRHRLRTS